MVDIHSHILPNLDDGAKSIEESISIVKKACDIGVTDLVVTPHFVFGSSYNANNKVKLNKFNELNKIIKKEKKNINLYLGNEVFVDNNLLDFIEKDYIMTINNSRYLFFELPMNGSYSGIEDLIFKLKTSGYIPIIAHPERYSIFKDNISLVERFIELGVLFQCNIGSFFGLYGERAKDVVLLLLKHQCIHFIASDTHHYENVFYDKIDELKQMLEKYIDKKEIDNLLVNNAKCVLENKTFDVLDVIPFKKNILGKWK